MSASHTREYRLYMQSAAWREKRRAVLARDWHQCKRCHTSHGLEVHHLTYDRLGREAMADLVTLCKRCHEIADQQRAYRARVDAWARKCWGWDWHWHCSWEQAEDAFDAWLESKDPDN